MSELATDYEITAADAYLMRGIALMPQNLRRSLLAKYAANCGTDALVALVAGFVGLANSVVANCRETAELQLLINSVHPETAEKINMPDVYGALGGVALADGITAKNRCESCAFRVGTPANQSSPTVSDAEDCLAGFTGIGFSCHEGLDATGEPIRLCAGYFQASRMRARRPTPAGKGECGGV